jgi:hypothetical protein
MGAPTPRRQLSTVLLLASGVCVIAIFTVLVVLGGWDYYRTPIGTRGYHPAHAALRPSGTIGLLLGIAGALSMISTLPYAARKRWRLLAKVGTPPKWLEAHIFFGIVGPVLVTLHTSFKFNGLISVGYWLMASVWASGFVGRYLYVRIPKSIRGVELSRTEIEAELLQARAQLDAANLPKSVRNLLDEFERTTRASQGAVPGLLDLFFGELRVRGRLLLMRRQLRASGLDLRIIDNAVNRAAQQAAMARRLAHLQRTRRLFELWHVFHQPLVFGMFVIVMLHVGIAVYLGYVDWLFAEAS